MRRSEEERCDAFRAAVESVLSSGAGYLILQGQFLSRNERIAAFVEEAEGDFVEVLSTGTDDEVQAAFDRLKAMAQSDGTFSDIEADCLAALVKRVSSERARIYTDRYPQVFAP